MAGADRSTAVKAALLCLAMVAGTNPLQEGRQRSHPIPSSAGLVSSQDRHASAAGMAMLNKGGNAIDAAVAASYALAVTLPQAGNLGGGGFLVFWNQPEQRGYALNFREMAPKRAHRDLFLNPDGSVNRERATSSLLSSGVPGTVAGLLKAHDRFGTLPRQVVMEPAIRLAREGFRVEPILAGSLRRAQPRLGRDPTARQLFYKSSGAPYAAGELLQQPELARTLQGIADDGHNGFYAGPVAQRLVTLMHDGGGLINHNDLTSYRAIWVEPVEGTFQGHRVLSMPPPSSGGVTLIQMLNLLEPLELKAMGLNSADGIHTLAEAMNLAYRDRNALLGDPDQIAVPTEHLISKAYAAQLRRSLNPQRHTPSEQLGGVAPLPANSSNTTHLSVADPQGSLVALTTTLNFAYGNGIAIPGTGVLLNNEMDDFTARPGAANAFGLIQGQRNAIAPGRRPLSSMTPTVVLRPDGSPWFATGSPGGSRIITTVLQVVLNRIVHGLNLSMAVLSPRVHSQLWPDALQIEQGISADTIRLLKQRGHTVKPSRAMGSANSVELGPKGGSLGVADPRRPEGAAEPAPPLLPPAQKKCR